MGSCLIIISTMWWGSIASFISILISGEAISDQAYLLLGGLLSSFAGLLWLIVFTNTMYKDKQKLILSIMTVFLVLQKIFYVYFVFTDISKAGTPTETPLKMNRTITWVLCDLVTAIVVLTTVFIFFRDSRKVKDPEIRLKGSLFLLGIVFFCLGQIMEVIPLSIFTLILQRMIYLFSILAIYCAFALPKWIKKRLRKEDM